MHGRSTTADQILARIAERAHGVADRDELLSKGVSDEQISTRLHRGSLIVVHKGVYRVGHAAPTTEATYMAAVKACGKGAVISGKAAAHLHGLIRSKTPPPHTARNDTGQELVRGDAQITLGKLERRFLQLLKKHRLPVPKTNKRENSFFVDCRWPEHNLTGRRTARENAKLERAKTSSVATAGTTSRGAPRRSSGS
jgi:hypothetical protein